MYLYKCRIEDAAGYIKFILDSVQSKEIFHSIAFKPIRSWEYLLWMDKSNHGGVRARMPRDLIQPPDDGLNDEIEVMDEEDSDESGKVGNSFVIEITIIIQ